jgi:hypothetical protein
MTTVNLWGDSERTCIEGDYLGDGGDLPRQAERALAATGAKYPTQAQLALTRRSPVTKIKARPVPDPKPLLNRMSVAAAEESRGGNQGRGRWKTVSTHRGWLIQKWEYPYGRPLYRGIWGAEVTKPRQEPRDVHLDIDRTAGRPRIYPTRLLSIKGTPDDFRAKGSSVREAWRARLKRARGQWGKTGHVETYHGVKIFRGKRNLTGPDGEKITVPVYYTKQRLTGIKTRVPSDQAQPLEGLGRGDGAEATASVAEADTIEAMKATIDEHPLAPSEKPAGPDALGPAAKTERVEALPGEAGTAPEPLAPAKDPKNRGLLIGGGIAAAVAAAMLMR